MTTTTEPLATTTEYFESVYAEAAGDAGRVPWASPHPNKALVNWLNAVAPTLVRCGARVAMVGCGLGADAHEVIRRGFDVTAFDCSGTAVAWARSLDPDHADSYVQADLFEPPGRWVRRFDLVIDINNIQALQPDLRRGAVSALARLVAPHGHLLVICPGAARPAGDDQEGPWPPTRDELVRAASESGLSPEGPVCCFADDQGVPRIRAVFRRGP
jgi:SAM-dependent methyltransferase